MNIKYYYSRKDIITTIKNSKNDDTKWIYFMNNIPSIKELANQLTECGINAKYLTAKERYLKVLKSINLDKEKLEELNKTKDEYEVDNIVLKFKLDKDSSSDIVGKVIVYFNDSSIYEDNVYQKTEKKKENIFIKIYNWLFK